MKNTEPNKLFLTVLALSELLGCKYQNSSLKLLSELQSASTIDHLILTLMSDSEHFVHRCPDFLSKVSVTEKLCHGCYLTTPSIILMFIFFLVEK
jgi:hypothetical protein